MSDQFIAAHRLNIVLPAPCLFSPDFAVHAPVHLYVRRLSGEMAGGTWVRGRPLAVFPRFSASPGIPSCLEERNEWNSSHHAEPEVQALRGVLGRRRGGRGPEERRGEH